MLKTIAASMLCAAAFLWVNPVNADQWDKKTTMTFSQPVELPGIILPAGTYIFKLVNSPSDRHIVQVFNVEETHLYTTILAIPNYRLTTPEETIVRFDERRADQPQAIRAWFYPGDNYGQEFVYPQPRATELAVNAEVPVLTAAVTPAEKPEEMVQEPVSTVTPEKVETPLPEVITPAPVTPEPQAAAKAEPEPELTPAPVETLPATGSPLPILMLIGFCALGGFAALRISAKHA